MLEQIIRPSGAMAGFLGQDNSQMLYTAHRFRNMDGKELQRRTGAMRLDSSRAKGEKVWNRRDPPVRPVQSKGRWQFKPAKPSRTLNDSSGLRSASPLQ